MKVVQLLLQHNTDIKARNNNNGAPLHHAARCNNTEVTQLLLAHNGDIEKSKKIMEHLFTMLHQIATEKWQNYYLNIMQTSKQRKK